MAPPSPVHGLDIHAKWNVILDRNAVPQFPLMSVKATEGKSVIQPGFLDMFKWFRERNFKYRGLYHWLRSDSSAEDQVNNVRRAIGLIGGLRPGEFIQNDWERTDGIPDPSVALVEEFNKRLTDQYGDRVITYASDWVPGFTQWRSRNPTHPLWYANYNTGSLPTSGWNECAKFKADVWQWTSTFQCPGFASGVDANYVFKFSTLDHISRQSAPPSNQPQPHGEDEYMQIWKRADNRRYLIYIGGNKALQPTNDDIAHLRAMFVDLYNKDGAIIGRTRAVPEVTTDDYVMDRLAVVGPFTP